MNFVGFELDKIDVALPYFFLKASVEACGGPTRYVNYNGFRLVIIDSPPTFFQGISIGSLTQACFQQSLIRN